MTNDPFSYWLSIVSAVLCKAGVPLFMMVSGALLLGKNESVRTVIKKRVLPFSVIFVVMYLLQYLRIVRAGAESFSILGYVQYLFSGSPIITYWFLRSYLIYLLSLPVLRLIAEHMTEDVFFLLIGVELFFLISGVITTATGFQISFGFPFHDVFVFCPLAGYYFSKKKDLFKTSFVIAFLVIAIVLAALFTHHMYQKNGFIESYFTGFVSVISICIFLLVNKLNITHWYSIVRVAGECSFGIYLIEDIIRNRPEFVIPVLIRFINEIGAAYIFVLCAYLVGLVIVFIGKKIPGIRFFLK